MTEGGAVARPGEESVRNETGKQIVWPTATRGGMTDLCAHHKRQAEGIAQVEKKVGDMLGLETHTPESMGPHHGACAECTRRSQPGELASRLDLLMPPGYKRKLDKGDRDPGYQTPRMGPRGPVERPRKQVDLTAPTKPFEPLRQSENAAQRHLAKATTYYHGTANEPPENESGYHVIPSGSHMHEDPKVAWHQAIKHWNDDESTEFPRVYRAHFNDDELKQHERRSGGLHLKAPAEAQELDHEPGEHPEIKLEGEEGPTLYHGTSHFHEPDDEDLEAHTPHEDVVPGGTATHGHLTRSAQHAYATPSLKHAWYYAHDRALNIGGTPHVYRVTPKNPADVEKDPMEDEHGTSRGNYEHDKRSPTGFDVLDEVPPTRRQHAQHVDEHAQEHGLGEYAEDDEGTEHWGSRRMATTLPHDHPDKVYLRFGHWPKDERSQNNAMGWREEGVSAYDLDHHGEPVDPDAGLNRYHEHDEHCEGDCDLDQWNEDYSNDTGEEMNGRVQRAETNRRRGRDLAGETGHLVKGKMIGVGHDGEPLLKNVRRVGDWIDHRHLFIPGAERHRLARDPYDEDYEPPKQNKTASLSQDEPAGCYVKHDGPCDYADEPPRKTAMPSKVHPEPEGFSHVIEPSGVEAPEQPTHRLIGAVNGQQVGQISFSKSDDGKAVHVHKLHVDEEGRGKGVASAMMDRLYSEHPDAWIDHGGRTKEGLRWWAQYKDPAPERNTQLHKPREGWGKYFHPRSVSRDMADNYMADPDHNPLLAMDYQDEGYEEPEQDTDGSSKFHRGPHWKGLRREAGRHEPHIEREAMRFTAHDSGDSQRIFHCPFCGAGQVIGRSDGTTECEFCQAHFTVQVQPQFNSFPQTINGQPVQIPGMPGQNDALVGDTMPPGGAPGAPGEPGNPDPTQDPDNPFAGGSGDDSDAQDDSGDEAADGDDDKPDFLKSKSYRTVTGAELTEEQYLRHLALIHAPDHGKMAEHLRRSRQ
jgi:GNAT superfamily N-acetyltransferase